MSAFAAILIFLLIVVIIAAKASLSDQSNAGVKLEQDAAELAVESIRVADLGNHSKEHPAPWFSSSAGKGYFHVYDVNGKLVACVECKEAEEYELLLDKIRSTHK